MIKRLFVLFFIFLFVFRLVTPKTVFADELDDINKQIDDFKHALEMSQKATKPLEEDVKRLKQQLYNIKLKVSNIERDIFQKEKNIKQGEKAFAYQKQLLNERVRSYYKNSVKKQSILLQIFVGENMEENLHNFFYQEKVINKDKKTIINIVLYIKNLQERKKDLEEEKKRLALVKTKIDKQSSFLEGEIGKAKEYQATLKNKIAQLTARQKQLIAQKLAALNLPTSLGAGPLYCTDDRKLNPGFSPAFAFYTYGIPHRVGMNQYGAYGRAKSGQNYDEILHAYFNFNEYQEKPDVTIKVNDGNGINSGNIIWTGSLEEYIKRIFEVPEGWPTEALKAQAVAARSYALAVTNNGEKSICATQNCQVFHKDPKGGNWEKAVNDTHGKVMVYQGQVIKAWYSSTDGGYTFTSGDVWGSNKGWTKHIVDANGGINSFSDLNQKAYDRDSKCFYAAQGWRDEYNKSAWLKPEEVADIANTILLSRADSSTQDHLYQPDKPNPAGTDTWNRNRVIEELKKRGIRYFNLVTNISVSADFSAGKTTSINISEGGHTENFSGSEFKNFFNLRAPANIQIVGPLYNIERR